uniref:Uncharacterized protein n=1 Tax=Oryza brachyantha TaxID=4533 RepID=J3LL49_ORYBR
MPHLVHLAVSPAGSAARARVLPTLPAQLHSALYCITACGDSIGRAVSRGEMRSTRGHKSCGGASASSRRALRPLLGFLAVIQQRPRPAAVARRATGEVYAWARERSRTWRIKLELLLPGVVSARASRQPGRCVLCQKKQIFRFLCLTFDHPFY